MKTLRSISAYLIALLLILVVPVSFVGLTDFARLIVNVTGLTINPLYSGGRVVRELSHGAYVTRLHAPVFESLVGRAESGFVQIDWAPKAGVPAVIDETVDYDADGRADFHVRWERAGGVPVLSDQRAEVLGVEGHYELAERYMVRVKLTAAK